jgi:hypothetical protein
MKFSINDFKDIGIIPAGVYTCIIAEAEERESRSNPNNRFLNLKIQIVGGEHDGRSFNEKLHLIRDGTGKNDTLTVSIAQKRLIEIMKATVGSKKKPDEELGIENESELCDIPFSAFIGVSESNGNFEAMNRLLKASLLDKDAVSRIERLAKSVADRNVVF